MHCRIYFNGFTGLADNQFGILRRPAASSDAADWMVPAGSALEPLSGAGRKLSGRICQRINISDFSQWGIGMFEVMPCSIVRAACTYSQGYYGNAKGTSCYVNSNGDSGKRQFHPTHAECFRKYQLRWCLEHTPTCGFLLCTGRISPPGKYLKCCRAAVIHRCWELIMCLLMMAPIMMIRPPGAWFLFKPADPKKEASTIYCCHN